MNEAEQDRRERWLHDDLTTDERVELEDALLADAGLAESVYAEVALDKALREVGGARRRGLSQRVHKVAPRPRSAWWIGAASVAAVLLLFVMRPSLFREGVGDREVLRRGDAAALELIEPRGLQSQFPERFVWSRFETAASYRWELYDAQARRVAVEVCPDTVLVRPAAMVPADSVGTWRWLVVAILESGAEGPTSPSQQFIVAAPGQDR